MLSLKRTSTKSFQIGLATKYNTNDALKESLVRGSKSAKGGPHPLADFDRRVSIFGMFKSYRNV